MYATQSPPVAGSGRAGPGQCLRHSLLLAGRGRGRGDTALLLQAHCGCDAAHVWHVGLVLLGGVLRDHLHPRELRGDVVGHAVEVAGDGRAPGRGGARGGALDAPCSQGQLPRLAHLREVQVVAAAAAVIGRQLRRRQVRERVVQVRGVVRSLLLLLLPRQGEGRCCCCLGRETKSHKTTKYKKNKFSNKERVLKK